MIPRSFVKTCPWQADGSAAKVAKQRRPATLATGGIAGQVPELGAAETQEAIGAAVTAQEVWARRTAGERANTLKEWFGSSWKTAVIWACS